MGIINKKIPNIYHDTLLTAQYKSLSGNNNFKYWWLIARWRLFAHLTIWYTCRHFISCCINLLHWLLFWKYMYPFSFQLCLLIWRFECIFTQLFLTRGFRSSYPYNDHNWTQSTNIHCWVSKTSTAICFIKYFFSSSKVWYQFIM